MNRKTMSWLIAAIIYSLFTAWYTDFGGPVTDHEIVQFVEQLSESGMNPDEVNYYADFLRNDTGNQFFMVNAIDMNDMPPAVEGAPADADASKLLELYMQHMFPELLKRASHPVIMGEAVHGVIDVLGIDGAEQWSSAAVLRYRSRRAFMEIVSNPEFLGPHDYKLAALNKTIAYPIELKLFIGDPRLLLALILLAITSQFNARH